MNDIKKENIPKYKANPLVASLPEYLKDPKNYDKIQKLVLETLAGKCSHSEVVEWASCPKCQRRFAERGQLLKKLGFSSSAQYMAWKEIHEHIKKRVTLPKYNS